jgi:probable phosphoglycerate mutase
MEVAQMIPELAGKGIELLYTAEGHPALETAKALGDALGLKVKKVERLRNMNQGLWQGMLIDEVRRRHPKVFKQWQEQPESVCPPEGETLSEARERVEDAVRKVMKRHRLGVVGVVASEPAASLVRSAVVPTVLGEHWMARNGHPLWELLSVDGATAERG